MAVRRTERNLPFGVEANDIGPNAASAAGTSILFSFNQNPVVVGRQQTLVVFVTDGALADTVDQYDWQLDNSGSVTAEQTAIGYLRFRPTKVGQLAIAVTLKNSGGQPVATITLQLGVVESNLELEAIYTQQSSVGPLAGQPETSREIINDVRAFIDELAPRDADADSTLNKLVFALAYARAMQMTEDNRARQLEDVASALDTENASVFTGGAREGYGTTALRPHVLSMYFNAPNATDPLIKKRHFPAVADKRYAPENETIEAFSGLSNQLQIDVFNSIRFPKLNVKMAVYLIEAMRADFYTAQTLRDVIADSGTGSDLIGQITNGPVVTE